MSLDRSDSCPPFFLEVPDNQEEGGRCHGQSDMAVPGSVTADLVVVEAVFVLGGLEAFLIAHRLPATRTGSSIVVSAGP